jgi:hypothetical protein
MPEDLSNSNFSWSPEPGLSISNSGLRTSDSPAMPETTPNPELLRSLGQLVRGLSALFWGLPMSLIICFGTGAAGWFHSFKLFGVVPAMIATGMLVFGLWQLGSFQPQERPWRKALDQARMLALLSFFLSPFPGWWNGVPGQPFFEVMVYLLLLTGLVFVFSLNAVLQRLGAMLPDENLRQEIRQYTGINRKLLTGSLAVSVVFFSLQFYITHVADVPEYVLLLGYTLHKPLVLMLLICFLFLLPFAMTMALIWKTKEVIMESVFGRFGRGL